VTEREEGARKVVREQKKPQHEPRETQPIRVDLETAVDLAMVG
jgi:hypothetical protein